MKDQWREFLNDWIFKKISDVFHKHQGDLEIRLHAGIILNFEVLLKRKEKVGWAKLNVVIMFLVLLYLLFIS